MAATTPMTFDPTDETEWDVEHPAALALAKATEMSARAAAAWVGHGEAIDMSRAARLAMKRALDEAPFGAEIVVGDGPDETNHRSPLSVGKTCGMTDPGVLFDLALDPTEGASFLTRGQTNAISIAALAPPGTMMRPGPAFYMAKFAAPPEAKGVIDPSAPVPEILETLARALGKKVSDLRVFVLEKPRHRRLIESIEGCGARVASFPAGDIAGVLMAAIPDSGIDAMMGTGGCSEGIISACAARAIGGMFCGRFDPQLSTEHAAVREAGLSTERWMDADDLVGSRNVLVAATGITTGLVLDGVERTLNSERTQTLILSGTSRDRIIRTAYRSLGGGQEYVDRLEAAADAVY